VPAVTMLKGARPCRLLRIRRAQFGVLHGRAEHGGVDTHGGASFLILLPLDFRRCGPPASSPCVSHSRIAADRDTPPSEAHASTASSCAAGSRMATVLSASTVTGRPIFFCSTKVRLALRFGMAISA